MHGEKKESYGLAGRIVMFVVVTGLGSALAYGLWISFAIHAGMSAGNGAGGLSLALIPLLWISGIVTASVMIFKK